MKIAQSEKTQNSSVLVLMSLCFLTAPVFSEITTPDPIIIEVDTKIVTDRCNDIATNLGDIIDDAKCSEIAQANTVIEGDSIRTSTTNVTNKLGQGIRSSFTGSSRSREVVSKDSNIQRQRGLSAGSELTNISVWTSYTHTHSEDDFVSTAYKLNSNNGLIGIDFLPMDKLVLGVALGFEDNDVKTIFNNGTQDISGYTVAPYLAYLISDTLSLDLTLGYSDYEIDQTRTDTTSGLTVNGDTESERWFTAVNLNGFKNRDRWFVSGRVGIVYAHENQEGYAETGTTGAFTNSNVADQTIKFGQLQIGGQLAYAFSNVEPFISAYYQYDFEREDTEVNENQETPANDDDDIMFSAGLRYFSSSAFSGVLQWDSILDREDFEGNSISLIGRYEF